jgi:hypothetical protein
MIYVASSWRNPFHTAVVAALKAADRQQPGNGFAPYDFKNPEAGNSGFHWTQVGMPTYEFTKNYEVPIVPVHEYLAGLEHPIAEQGFKYDFEAMEMCTQCVLVLPCGRSAHLEAGWFIGQGRPTYILLNNEPANRTDEMMVIPELMYKMATGITDSLFDLLGLLGIKD